MAEYKVNSEQVDSTATQIAGKSGEIMEQLNTIIKLVAATESFWTGNANQTYADLMRRWKGDADSVRQNLDQTVEALRKAAQDYAATEGAQVTRFSV